MSPDLMKTAGIQNKFYIAQTDYEVQAALTSNVKF